MVLLSKMPDAVVPFEQVVPVMADELEDVFVAGAAHEAALQLVLVMADCLKLVVVGGAAQQVDLQLVLLMDDNLNVVVVSGTALKALLPSREN